MIIGGSSVTRNNDDDDDYLLLARIYFWVVVTATIKLFIVKGDVIPLRLLGWVRMDE